MSAAPLAVVVKGWPRLSETFIAQELVALEAAGQAFEIWSLRHPTDAKTHPLHDRLHAPVHYLPEYLRDEPWRVARAVVRMAARRPFWWALRLWLGDLARDRTRNRARRFGQACVLAAETGPALRGFYAHFLHTPSSVARYAAVIRDLPWAASAHAKDIWTSPAWDLREKLTEAQAGAEFVATCTEIGATHLRGLADREDRVSLVYHGLDLARFPDPPAARRPGGRFRILSVGRLVEKKGFDRLIAALARLPETLDWEWHHIGGGEMKTELGFQADAAGIAPRITWHGAQDQPFVIEAMRAADLFVLPVRIAADGDRDGLPNVLMEAASQKLPILATAVSAIPEFITDGEHGVLSDDAPEALAHEITLLAGDPDLRAKLADRAYQRLRSHFQMAPGIAGLNTRLAAMMTWEDG